MHVALHSCPAVQVSPWLGVQAQLLPLPHPAQVSRGQLLGGCPKALEMLALEIKR